MANIAKKNPPKTKIKYRTRTVEVARKASRRVRQVASEEKHTLGAMGAGALLGVLEARAVALPHIPFLGVAGTYGVALWFLGRQTGNKMLQHLGTGLLSIAGYQLTAKLASGKLFATVTNPQGVTMPVSDPYAAPAPALTGAPYLDNHNQGLISQEALLGAVEEALDGLDDDDLDGLDDDDLDGLDDDDLNGITDDDLDGLDDDDLDGLGDEDDLGDDDDGLDGLDDDDLDGLDDEYDI